MCNSVLAKTRNRSDLNISLIQKDARFKTIFLPIQKLLAMSCGACVSYGVTPCIATALSLFPLAHPFSITALLTVGDKPHHIKVYINTLSRPTGCGSVSQFSVCDANRSHFHLCLLAIYDLCDVWT